MTIFRTLLGIQFSGIGAMMTRRGTTAKTSKKYSGKTVAELILWIFLGVSLIVGFGALFSAFAAPLHQNGFDWLYMTILMLVCGAMMLVGTVFLAKNVLFEAKDNALLLSMPIPPSTILCVRMVSLYLMNLLWGITVYLPGVACWIYFVGFSAVTVFGSLVMFLLSALFVLALSCLLGWVLSWLTARIRNKTFFSVVFSLICIAAYYVFIGSGSGKLVQLLMFESEIAADALGAIAPLYWLGDAIANGTPISMLLSVAILLLPFAAIYMLLSATFLKTVTVSYGLKRIRYDAQKHTDVSSAAFALFKRENARLLSSSLYLLNGGIGVLMLAAAAVFALIRYDVLMGTFAVFGQDMIPALFCGISAMLVGMSLFTPPSVSLESKTLWVLRSLPVTSKQILHAKWRLHIAWCALPVFLMSVVGMIFLFTFDTDMTVLDPAIAAMLPQVQTTAFDYIAGAAALLVLPQLFSVAAGGVGLLLGLRFPNLHWTTEAQVIKQGVAVFLSMFGNLALAGIPALTVYYGRSLLPVSVWLLIWMAVFAVGAAVIRHLIGTWGTKKFETLTA